MVKHELDLKLPSFSVPDRVSVSRKMKLREKNTFAELDGPGCIQHLWVVLNRPERMPLASRRIIIRIFFDDIEIPYVEAPVGDFFGVMHGQAWYPVDNHFLSVKAWTGYNGYFPMPFAKSAKIEFETGPDDIDGSDNQITHSVFLQADWDRYPNQTLTEPKRFCTRWRREMPTQRYGEDFLMLDADGPGQMLGFVYGVRLLDDVDRWSHGGAENIYIDGEGENPVYLRGIGGEDTFGSGYGGALHPPETHHYAAMPYYVHEDVGEARPAQRLVGYRFFERERLPFQQSIHMRFGCMANDICSTVYWYQQGEVRPFFEIPEWSKLLPGAELPRGICDQILPSSGEWWLSGPFANHNEKAMQTILPPEKEFKPDLTFDGLHGEESPWLTEDSRQKKRDVARWVKRAAHHGFIDFNHVFRPCGRGVARTAVGAAVARCVLHAPSDMTANLQLAWDDALILRVNNNCFNLGQHSAFRPHNISVNLQKGANTIVLKLSNDLGSNWGGWALAFLARTSEGQILIPNADALKTI